MTAEDPGPDAEPEDPEEAQPSAFEGVGSDIVSQLALTAITSPDPVSLAIAVVGPLLPRGLGVVTKRAKAFKKKRQDATLRVAAAAAGESAQEMVHRIENNPNISSFVDSAVNAGGNSTYPSRIRALGAALATGVLADDTDVIDVEQMVVETLGRLERPHVRVLLFMTQFEQRDQDEDHEAAPHHSWRYATLFNELESLRPVLPRLLADLTSVGILTQTTETYSETFGNGAGQDMFLGLQGMLAVNDFGIECLRRLYLAGLDDDPVIWQDQNRTQTE